MSSINRILRIVVVVGALAGCQTIQPTASSTDTHTAMVDWIDPAAVIVWDVGSRAMSEASGSHERLMNDESWTKLGAAAQQLALHFRRLANASPIRVGAHNDELVGFASGLEIQARIDADPGGFRRLARVAAEHSENLAAAAKMRDPTSPSFDHESL